MPENKQRGNKLGLMLFEMSLKLFGLSGAYGLLYFVCPYYMLFDRPVFSASMAYINRRYKKHTTLKKIFYAYKLFINQGKNLIDRFYVVSGQGEFDVDIHGYEKVENYLNNPERGVVLLTAHVGNWQVTMTALGRWRKKIHLLMRPEDNPAVKDVLHIDKEEKDIRIISPEGYLGGVIELTKAINDGDVVSIMGDRNYGVDSIEVDFLGDVAYFPYGAFNLAAATQCPVVVLLSAKVSTKKYMVYISDVIEPRYSLKRKKHEEFKEWVQWFANILENYVESHPLQWFVFNDIWVKNK